MRRIPYSHIATALHHNRGVWVVRSVPSRFLWIDTAKGLSILLVVILHVSVWYAQSYAPGHPLHFFSETFRFVRMPLFFFISGFLARSALARPLSGAFNRTVGLYVIYAFWTLAYCLLIAGRSGAMRPTDYLLAILLPTVFWYIWVLPFFFVAAWVLHRLPGIRPAPLLLVLVVLSAVSPSIRAATGNLLPAPAFLNIHAIASNMLWFFAGIHGRDAWLRLIASGTPRRAALSVAAFVASAVATVHWGLGDYLKVPLSILALYASAQVLGNIDQGEAIPQKLAKVGENTLPVYIFHIFGVAIVSGISKVAGLDRLVGGSPMLWGFVVIPAVALLLTIASRVGSVPLVASRFRFLIVPMGMPEPLARRWTTR